jgi:hypothetical protein
MNQTLYGLTVKKIYREVKIPWIIKFLVAKKGSFKYIHTNGSQIEAF